MDEPLIELLYQAADAEVGLAIKTNDPERLRQKLYRVRGDDPKLQNLTFAASPFDPLGELWIVRKDAKDRTAAAAKTHS